MHRLIAWAGALLLTLWSVDVRAANLLETADLGPTGQSGGGATVSSSSWFGAVFSVSEASRAVSVSAHLRATSMGPIFAAILPVDPMTGVPPCLDLSCALTVELFTPTDPSSESIVPMDVMLPVGDYAVIFGSGDGGATAQGLATLNNPMIGNPTFLGKVFFQGEFIWIPQVGQIDARFTLALADCGDGVTDTGEACDDGNGSDTDACLSSCLDASCGDGFVRAGVEACDDGNVADTDACLSNCIDASCGDGFVQAGVEACDPGDDSGPPCTADCELEAMETTSGSTTGSGGDSSSSGGGESSSSTGSTSGTSSGSESGSNSSGSSDGDSSTTTTSTPTSGGTTSTSSDTTSSSSGMTSSGATSAADAQTETGGETGDATLPDESGCACQSSSVPSGAPLGLILMGLLARRSRRRDRQTAGVGRRSSGRRR